LKLDAEIDISNQESPFNNLLHQISLPQHEDPINTEFFNIMQDEETKEAASV
jgi:hypothetical protein